MTTAQQTALLALLEPVLKPLIEAAASKKVAEELAKKTPANDSEWLTTREAAKYIGCKNGSPKSLEAWRVEGIGPKGYRTETGKWRYRREDLDLWVMGKKEGK